ncbi:orotidine-5'-phosphate decarboxylase [Rhodohalobacter halophilus]|uniref:orotidine-5'-phosphate decarboxylase n=1 Tax=Rhodohalobacter halophilus TaxID=1812810 RepID=UPI00083F9427|nr:orotidine-5'-phosphate decarboxylase [Rhodohalobacter halophilus]
MTFTEKLQRAVRSSGSLVCVGLDPDPQRIPQPLKNQYSNKAELIFEFCRRVVEATKVDACAYKPNIAFFEALGSEGWQAFEKLLNSIPSNRIVIADVKRGDIGNTSKKYCETYFDRYAVDAVTLNPLMGLETLEPFLESDEHAIFALTMTSNPGAADFLQQRFQGRMSLGEYIAEALSKKQKSVPAPIGMVVGATQAEAAKPVIRAFPDSHLLIPGVGAQGGSIDELAQTLLNHRGIPVINSSRGIIYAGGDAENWIEHVAGAATKLKESLRQITDRYV